MSKKFGINTKAAEARARKDAVKQVNEQEKQQRLEDEFWKDEDKDIQKKQQRKEDREKKENDKLQRKQEIQKLLEQEEAALSASKSKKNADLVPKKVTQAQIQQQQTMARTSIHLTDEMKGKYVNDEEISIEENLNHLQIDGASARNVDQAIEILSSNDSRSVDSHPEKRMKAAYQTFEEKNLSRLKEEHPTLRLSQLKQLLKKEWLKSPENPFNQPTKLYNQSNQGEESNND